MLICFKYLKRTAGLQEQSDYRNSWITGTVGLQEQLDYRNSWITGTVGQNYFQTKSEKDIFVVMK